MVRGVGTCIPAGWTQGPAAPRAPSQFLGKSSAKLPGALSKNSALPFPVSPTQTGCLRLCSVPVYYLLEFPNLTPPPHSRGPPFLNRRKRLPSRRVNPRSARAAQYLLVEGIVIVAFSLQLQQYRGRPQHLPVNQLTPQAATAITNG